MHIHTTINGSCIDIVLDITLTYHASFFTKYSLAKTKITFRARLKKYGWTNEEDNFSTVRVRKNYDQMSAPHAKHNK